MRGSLLKPLGTVWCVLLSRLAYLRLRGGKLQFRLRHLWFGLSNQQF